MDSSMTQRVCINIVYIILIQNILLLHWILKGVSTTFQSGRYTLSYRRGRVIVHVIKINGDICLYY